MAAANPRIGADAVRVIFLGPPGAGKGTQAAKLASHLGVPKIGTGEMLRTAIAQEDAAGPEGPPDHGDGEPRPGRPAGGARARADRRAGLRPRLRARRLPPDPAAGAGARGDVRRPAGLGGLRLRGAPRRCSCSGSAGGAGARPARPPSTCRTTPRSATGVCDGCGTGLVQREDDHESVVARRLQEYDARTFPLIEYYRSRARMIPIDGNRPMDVVFRELLEGGRGAGVSVQKSWSELQTMARACRIVVDTLDALEAAAVPGTTTKEMDRIAREHIERAGARPAFLGYRGYPATLCISVNEEVVHGIPGPRKLREGDIVGLDLGCIVDGFFGDAARTVAVGRVSEEAARLMRVTARRAVRRHRRVPPRQAGGRHRPRGADPRRAPRLLRGAGVRGPRDRHQPPRGAAGAQLRARRAGGSGWCAGMCLAIEPMVNVGQAGGRGPRRTAGRR